MGIRRRFLLLLFVSTCACRGGSEGRSREIPRRVLFQNRYWAQPGMADEVYRWRLHATDVQAEMGLRRGRVLRGAGGLEPDVVWQIELTPEQSAEFGRIEKEKMATFQPVKDHMRTLIRRFESSSYDETAFREHGAEAEVR
jgi:hypothetical protein